MPISVTPAGRIDDFFFKERPPIFESTTEPMCVCVDPSMPSRGCHTHTHTHTQGGFETVRAGPFAWYSSTLHFRFHGGLFFLLD